MILHGLIILIGIFFLTCNIYAEQTQMVLLPAKMVFAAGIIIIWTMICFYHTTQRQRNRRWKGYLLGLFLYYLWVLLNVLFFDAAFGRDSFQSGINLEPFFTIRNYLRAYYNGNFPLKLLLMNIIGNIAAFAPMAVFLPALCRPMRNFFLYTIFLAALILTVEYLQIYTNTGNADIDDFILNLFGAVLMWFLIQIPPIKRKLYGIQATKGSIR